ncbi:hypothetical protein ACI2LC_24175 [Nonomuraea wenchangensis]|uniref:hypothetical protein n=1 Tax=Nonomuraea wenchangensis TaxID=568860 RepID=UPI00384A4F0B
MSFQASKLRVQLPYDGGDEPPAALMQSGARCTYYCTCYLTNIDYCHCSLVAEDPARLVAGPEALPLLREELEQRLAAAPS